MVRRWRWWRAGDSPGAVPGDVWLSVLFRRTLRGRVTNPPRAYISAGGTRPRMSHFEIWISGREHSRRYYGVARKPPRTNVTPCLVVRYLDILLPFLRDFNLSTRTVCANFQPELRILRRKRVRSEANARLRLRSLLIADVDILRWLPHDGRKILRIDCDWYTSILIISTQWEKNIFPSKTGSLR